MASCDLRSEEDLRRAVRRTVPEVAFHLAWWTEPGAYLTSVPWNLASVRFTLSLVEELLAVGCGRIVGAGSCAEYSLGPPVLREDGEVRPATLYGTAKLAAGQISVAAAEQAGARLAWARIFYVHGPGEDPRRAVPRIIAGLLTGQPPELGAMDQHRDFLHVSDVADALVALATDAVHGPVNICSGQPISLREIDEIARDVLGLAPPPAASEALLPPIVGDSSLLRRTGWRPRFDQRSAVVNSVAWWRTRAEDDVDGDGEEPARS